MEHIVKKLKILFQTSGPSNKSESMVKKSKAISGISAICDAYDSASNVIVRAKHHKAKTSQDEEEKVIKAQNRASISNCYWKRIYQIHRHFSSISCKVSSGKIPGLVNIS